MVDLWVIITLSMVELYLIWDWFIKDSHSLAVVKHAVMYGEVTKFNPENKPIGELKGGDLLKPFVGITSQRDADQYLEKLIDYSLIEHPTWSRWGGGTYWYECLKNRAWRCGEGVESQVKKLLRNSKYFEEKQW